MRDDRARVRPGAKPAVYIDAKLAMLDDGTRAAALAAIDSLADVAGGGAADLGERAATPSS